MQKTVISVRRVENKRSKSSNCPARLTGLRKFPGYNYRREENQAEPGNLLKLRRMTWKLREARVGRVCRTECQKGESS